MLEVFRHWAAMKKTTVKKIVDFLLDNYLDIATVSVALFVVLRHRIKPFDLPTLAAWIIAVMALLAASGLWDRNRRLRRLEDTLNETRSLVDLRLSPVVHADAFLSADVNRDQIKEAMSSAVTIYVCGLTLARTSRQFMELFARRLQAGATIRLMMLDPTKRGLMEVMAARSMGNTTAEYWNTRLNTVVDVIKAIPTGAKPGGILEIAYVPFPTSFGLFMIDPAEPHGKIFVEIYHHRTAENNAAFVLTSMGDPHWYSFFNKQWHEAWAVSRIQKVETAPLIPSPIKAEGQ
jgi:hypothetical protein